MKKTLMVLLAGLAAGTLTAPRSGLAHCQVPCGIYDDPARIAALREDAATVAKAIAGLQELAGKADAQSWNQAVRWTTTKEDHASHVITVVAEYFLTQRVKPVEPGAEGWDAYVRSLADHHAVMRAAMVAKQTPTPESAAALSAAIETLAKRY